MSNLSAVLKDLKQQHERAARELELLDQAMGALSGLGGRNSSRGGRRKISRAGRKRIIAAQKARWAKWRAKHE